MAALSRSADICRGLMLRNRSRSASGKPQYSEDEPDERRLWAVSGIAPNRLLCRDAAKQRMAA